MKNEAGGKNEGVLKEDPIYGLEIKIGEDWQTLDPDIRRLLKENALGIEEIIQDPVLLGILKGRAMEIKTAEKKWHELRNSTVLRKVNLMKPEVRRRYHQFKSVHLQPPDQVIDAIRAHVSKNSGIV